MGAMARIMLTEAAAAKWNVPPKVDHVAKGFVIHGETKKKQLRFADRSRRSQLKPPPIFR